MSAARAGLELGQRSPWRVLLPVLAFAVVLVATYIARVVYRAPSVAFLVLTGGIGLLAIWAVLDGGSRLLGRATFLGTGRGIDRLFGLLQALMAIGLAAGLLPNAIALLERLARMAGG